MEKKYLDMKGNELKVGDAVTLREGGYADAQGVIAKFDGTHAIMEMYKSEQYCKDYNPVKLSWPVDCLEKNAKPKPLIFFLHFYSDLELKDVEPLKRSLDRYLRVLGAKNYVICAQRYPVYGHTYVSEEYGGRGIHLVQKDEKIPYLGPIEGPVLEIPSAKKDDLRKLISPGELDKWCDIFSSYENKWQRMVRNALHDNPFNGFDKKFNVGDAVKVIREEGTYEGIIKEIKPNKQVLVEYYRSPGYKNLNHLESEQKKARLSTDTIPNVILEQIKNPGLLVFFHGRGRKDKSLDTASKGALERYLRHAVKIKDFTIIDSGFDNYYGKHVNVDLAGLDSVLEGGVYYSGPYVSHENFKELKKIAAPGFLDSWDELMGELGAANRSNLFRILYGKPVEGLDILKKLKKANVDFNFFSLEPSLEKSDEYIALAKEISALKNGKEYSNWLIEKGLGLLSVNSLRNDTLYDVFKNFSELNYKPPGAEMKEIIDLINKIKDSQGLNAAEKKKSISEIFAYYKVYLAEGKGIRRKKY